MWRVGREELKSSLNGKKRNAREGKRMKDQDEEETGLSQRRESLLRHCGK